MLEIGIKVQLYMNSIYTYTYIYIQRERERERESEEKVFCKFISFN